MADNCTKQEAIKRLFVGVTATGVVYCDKSREENRDYLVIARVFFDTLILEWVNKETTPENMLELIRVSATDLQSKRGQEYKISASGQSIILGYATYYKNEEMNHD